jgi:hypothetical protein
MEFGHRDRPDAKTTRLFPMVASAGADTNLHERIDQAFLEDPGERTGV